MINIGKMSKQGKEVILQEKENGCWECISHCKDKDGYVRIRYNHKHERLFRVLFQKKYEEIPKGKVLRHLCNNAWCCNPDHLKIGTQKENYQDIVDCGRSLKGKENKKIRGINNGANKLKENDVIEIYLSKEKNSVLAKKYNVSKTNIIYIKKKKQWKWLTDKLN